MHEYFGSLACAMQGSLIGIARDWLVISQRGNGHLNYSLFHIPERLEALVQRVIRCVPGQASVANVNLCLDGFVRAGSLPDEELCHGDSGAGRQEIYSHNSALDAKVDHGSGQ